MYWKLLLRGGLRILLVGWLLQAHAQDRARCLETSGPIHFDPSGWKTDFCRSLVPLSEIRSGGPPRDGIPPIDHPEFVRVAEADQWLEDAEPVLFFAYQGDVRAYPLQILVWHEIVNDRVGGLPVAITFCPLCHAALVFVRPEVDGVQLTFGTTGNLRHSDLVMWDRQTESWWQQFEGRAIVGRLAGYQLQSLPAMLIDWRTFKQQYPEGRVLSRQTGYRRPYGRNPYPGYERLDRPPFLRGSLVDDRLPPMRKVVGVVYEGQARAYPLTLLQRRRVLMDTLGGAPLVLFWKAGAAAALDGATVAAGKKEGSVGVFLRKVKEQLLTFEARSDGFYDRETGSRWAVTGHAIDGPLQGARLTPLVHHTVFWFVWAVFQPTGTLYDEARSDNGLD